MHVHASCVCGFILAETMAHLPYTGFGKNKLKVKSVIQNCPESHFMTMRLKCCVANSLHASNGGKKWVNSISFNRKLWLMMLSVSRLANQVYDSLLETYETGDDCNSLSLTILCQSSLLPKTVLNCHNGPQNFWIMTLYPCSSRSCI